MNKIKPAIKIETKLIKLFATNDYYLCFLPSEKVENWDLESQNANQKQEPIFYYK